MTDLRPLPINISLILDRLSDLQCHNWLFEHISWTEAKIVFKKLNYMCKNVERINTTDTGQAVEINDLLERWVIAGGCRLTSWCP